MNLYQIIFFIPCATCLLCWNQINNSLKSTVSCELCAVSHIEFKKYGVSLSSSVKMCALNNSECNTICRDAINVIAVMDPLVRVTSCKGACCETDLCNNEDLLDNVPYYNDASQGTG
ncbi:uncharacterized protein LOC100215835 [Hydra vulgaris]|uniref:uncharacterized protein LOC100215835 n=1 Tax=Hydra vulgaris TaxID=6087 RepID=UPI001F5EB922|nr:uncharacterized protein LOC100215835 [Hydra vulgaris]